MFAAAESLQDALKQLYLIDAIDEDGLITRVGKTMAGIRFTSYFEVFYIYFCLLYFEAWMSFSSSNTFRILHNPTIWRPNHHCMVQNIMHVLKLNCDKNAIYLFMLYLHHSLQEPFFPIQYTSVWNDFTKWVLSVH